MKSPHTSTEAHGRPSSATPRLEGTRDVLDVLTRGIAKTAVRETQREPLLQAQKVPVEPGRELLTEKMLADRWVCSVARLQRWRTFGEGPPYLKIVGKVLYRLKDIEAYEEASLVRKVF
ncbi:hypothetical protein [Limnohabitans sp.]|uniref:hypothetical protein n=1 Tax=Limnohabitans sp. TaxID=1907725 RepID=UPI0035ADFAC5